MSQTQVENRRCAECGSEHAVCVEVTRLSVEGIFPSGSIYEYACSSCGKHFKIDSVWRSIITTLGSSLPLGLAGLVAWAYFIRSGADLFDTGTWPQGSNWALWLILALSLVSLGVHAHIGFRIAQRFRNPPVRK